MPSKSDNWSERWNAIREILGMEAIRSQEELLERLQSRGFCVTQSSVSRDLRELKVVKVAGRYVPSEALAGNATLSDEMNELATSVRRIRIAGPYLLVVNTPPGRAPAVGHAIDHAGWPEVVGCIAGDDTVFVATAGRREQAKIEARLEKLKKGMSYV